ncbi:MAG: hypothetical protein WA902_04965 [Thermosynechococcaceae cyanobacterium]
MMIREQIKAEIDNLDDKDLDELYNLIKDFVQIKLAPSGNETFMSRLKQIEIDAPEDFSTNLDQYMTEGQQIE